MTPLTGFLPARFYEQVSILDATTCPEPPLSGCGGTTVLDADSRLAKKVGNPVLVCDGITADPDCPDVEANVSIVVDGCTDGCTNGTFS